MLLFNLTTFYHDILTFLNVRQCCTNNCRENQLCSFVGLILNLLVHLHKWPPSPMQCSVLMKAEDTACPPAFFCFVFPSLIHPYLSALISACQILFLFGLYHVCCYIMYVYYMLLFIFVVKLFCLFIVYFHLILFLKHLRAVSMHEGWHINKVIIIILLLLL